MHVHPFEPCGENLRTENGYTHGTYLGGFCQPPLHWPSSEDGEEGPATDTPGGGTARYNQAGDNKRNFYALGADASPNHCKDVTNNHTKEPGPQVTSTGGFQPFLSQNYNF